MSRFSQCADNIIAIDRNINGCCMTNRLRRWVRWVLANKLMNTGTHWNEKRA